MILKYSNSVIESMQGIRIQEEDTFMMMVDFSKQVRFKVTNFYGKLDHTAFLDWLHTMDDYFAWYNMSEEKKIGFATANLRALQDCGGNRGGTLSTSWTPPGQNLGRDEARVKKRTFCRLITSKLTT